MVHVFGDYIHVTDLAMAHVLAVQALANGAPSNIYNLGNGNGYSVLEVIKTAEKVVGKNIPVKYSERRPGDPAVLVAASDKIRRELDWEPLYPSLESIVKTAWQWHSGHPEGFGKHDTIR